MNPGGSPFDTHAVEQHIPTYLTAEQKQALASALSRLPDEKEYFAPGKYQGEMLQGDCWDGLDVVDVVNGQKKSVKALILSNSCDIAPDNRRDLPAKVVFAPIVKLSSYRRLLGMAKIPPNKIHAKVESIKNQLVTTLFYIPDALGGLGEEYIAILDDIHSIPSSMLDLRGRNRKLFTLNTLGFYLFIFKISVHFCRLREDVDRS